MCLFVVLFVDHTLLCSVLLHSGITPGVLRDGIWEYRMPTIKIRSAPARQTPSHCTVISTPPLLLYAPRSRRIVENGEMWFHSIESLASGGKASPELMGLASRHLFLTHWDFDPNKRFIWAVRALSLHHSPLPVERKLELLRAAWLASIPDKGPGRDMGTLSLMYKLDIIFGALTLKKSTVKMLSSPSNTHFQNHWSERVY